MFIAFLKRQWFLVGLVILVSSGLVTGANLDAEQRESVSGIVEPKWITVIVLFLMAFSLDSAKLKASLRNPGPVLWAALVNAVGIPLGGWVLMSWQVEQSLAVGLMIAASVPCTLAAVSVWTRKAGGNDAVSLLVTLLTNTCCFLVTPFWLNLAIPDGKSALNVRDMIFRLLAVVLVPTILGQGVRLLPAAREFATRYKSRIGFVAQGLILVLVFSAAALKAGPQLRQASVGIGPVLGVWACCVGLHVLAMIVGWGGARLFRFSTEDRIAVLFGSSQKTLPIGVYLATSPELSEYAFAVFPMLMYHASQLFIDTIIADRIAARAVAPTEDG